MVDRQFIASIHSPIQKSKFYFYFFLMKNLRKVYNNPIKDKLLFFYIYIYKLVQFKPSHPFLFPSVIVATLLIAYAIYHEVIVVLTILYYILCVFHQYNTYLTM